jgi:hypothetical protein
MKKAKKMTFNKETLRTLDAPRLDDVIGGVTTRTLPCSVGHCTSDCSGRCTIC